MSTVQSRVIGASDGEWGVDAGYSCGSICRSDVAALVCKCLASDNAKNQVLSAFDRNMVLRGQRDRRGEIGRRRGFKLVMWVVEVEQIEKLCGVAADRPVILLLPRLEDAAIVGIGYAARQLRDRFNKTLTTAYYIGLLSDEVAIYRCFPGQW